jgi:hypothetical protein
MPRKKAVAVVPAIEAPPIDLTAAVIEFGDPYPKLRDWQRHYATWLASLNGTPLMSQRRRKAHQLAGYEVKPKELQRLEQREDFVLFMKGIVAEDVSTARKFIEQQSLKAMQQMVAMKDAAYQAGDYKEFFKYAAPFLERVWPKQEERKDQRTQVVVNIAAGSAPTITASAVDEIETVEVEVLASPDDVTEESA